MEKIILSNSSFPICEKECYYTKKKFKTWEGLRFTVMGYDVSPSYAKDNSFSLADDFRLSPYINTKSSLTDWLTQIGLRRNTPEYTEAYNRFSTILPLGDLAASRPHGPETKWGSDTQGLCVPEKKNINPFQAMEIDSELSQFFKDAEEKSKKDKGIV